MTFTDDVAGPGSYTGNIAFSDSFSPGASPATVSFENVKFDASAPLLIELGGLLPGTEYDQVLISGVAMLDGPLVISLIDGFQPNPGDHFDILSYGSRIGAFREIVGNDLGNGVVLSPLYGDSGMILVAQVPEPSTLLLLTLGLTGLGWLRYRRVVRAR